jgi:hypothetical protein
VSDKFQGRLHKSCIESFERVVGRISCSSRIFRIPSSPCCLLDRVLKASRLLYHVVAACQIELQTCLTADINLGYLSTTSVCFEKETSFGSSIAILFMRC